MIPYHGSQYSGKGGHYESWFLRANHPQQARAFWIRYTQFIPDDNRPPLGEIWAIWFDAEGPHANRPHVVAVKHEAPLAVCDFGSDTMRVALPGATLRSHHLQGDATSAGHSLAWTLEYRSNDDRGQAPSLMFLPEELYQKSLPKAKALVSRPNVYFSGHIVVDGEHYTIDRWQGSENHNWGRKHTDQYAWGQVAGFDNAPDSFLECITARVKLGPLLSPQLTIACLRLDGEEYMFNRIGTALRATSRYAFFDWQFRTRRDGHQLAVQLQAPPSHFTALTYFNPPGGSKTCLNSKIAHCEAILTPRGQTPRTLISRHGAAFEILTDKEDHGIAVSV